METTIARAYEAIEAGKNLVSVNAQIAKTSVGYEVNGELFGNAYAAAAQFVKLSGTNWIAL